MLTRITAPQPTATRALPSTTARPPVQVIHLAVAVVEAMTGRRPLHHLRARLSSSAFDQLVAHRRSKLFRQSRIGTWRCQMPHENAAEITIRISLARRWLVCVLRMDRRSGWSCTDFAVLGV